MYFIALDLLKIAKLIEEKTNIWLHYRGIGDEINSVCT
jgi:hypothetical protein